MALQSAVGRGNNPFIGGSKTPNAPPPAMGGSIAPANTSVSSPEGGVSPGQPMFARNNRGSNIGIPYTRLVPLGNARYGLDGTPYTDGNGKIHDYAYGSGTAGVKKNVITETEDLRATRVGFIHGRRRRPGATSTLEEYERGQDVNGIFNNNYQYMMAPGMPGTERFQKLCSLEYLQRYFAHALRPGEASITIGELEVPGKMDPATGVPKNRANGDLAKQNQNSWWTSGLLRMVLRHTDTQADDPEGVLKRLEAAFGGERHAGDVGDVAKAFGLDDSPMDTDYPRLRQGIFAQDTGPFLRGKGITQDMVRCTKYRDAPQQVDNDATTGDERYVQAFNISRCLGDEVAFDMLEHALEDLGVTDWRPDGIVLSKGANDPSDKLSDEAFEVRDGQLYNMRIQGPALSTTWTGDPALEVLPLDKVFIVIVADVWFRGLPTDLNEKLKTDVGAGLANNEKVEAVESARATAKQELAVAKGQFNTADVGMRAATARRDKAIADGDGAVQAAADTDLATFTTARWVAAGQVNAAEDGIRDAYQAVYNGSPAFASEKEYQKARRIVAVAEGALREMQLAKKVALTDLKTADSAAIKALVAELEANKVDAYMKKRDAELTYDAVTKDTLEDFQANAEDLYKDGDESKKTVLTNFRVRTATSSQMINYSPLRFNGAGEQDVDTGGAPDEFRKVYYSSRMGLALTDDMGEYIVGGWCIGNVLDTSASRAVMPGAGSNIGVRTAPNSMAHNINVQIEWWDADRMWRNFCNVTTAANRPSLTPRHQQTWEEPGKGSGATPAGADVLLAKDRPPAADDIAGGAARPSLAIYR